MTVYGYVRVSTKEQTTENQKGEILSAGYAISEENWYSDDGVSGKVSHKDRPAFAAMFAKVVAGDTCIVNKMDRLGRTAADSLNVMVELRARGVKVIILQFGGLDMSSSTGKLVFTILAAVAEMERDLVVERTQAGLTRTEAAGTKLGRSLVVLPDTLEKIIQAREDGKSYDWIAKKFEMPKQTVVRSIGRWAGATEEYRATYQGQQSQIATNRQKRVK